VSNQDTRRRVVIAMSGGVDSSVAAALLKRDGYEVVGLMLRLWGEPDRPGSAYNRCCSPDSIAQARRVAEILDIPFYVLDAQAAFKRRVVDFFVTSYAAGITPNPCLECNRHVRWDFLLRHALAMGAGWLATGHYARVRQLPADEFGRPAAFQLLKGLDESKDQSYVLSVLGQTQLQRALFPVGEHTKDSTRQMARDFKLPVAEREESQDLCFLADNDYRRFLREHAGGSIRPGPIVRRDGSVVGRHQGLPFYTVGQRKGIGVASPEALYVLETQPDNNALVVGTADELGRNRLTAGHVNWVSNQPPTEVGGRFRAEVKVRYRARPLWAHLTVLAGQRVEAVFDQSVRDITPGQAAVFYNGDVCLGGGVIERPEP
jgi:tRNA-uridine 2-sulfurtransferase